MQIVIEIPEETYNDIQSRDWKNGELIFSEEWKAIHNGTPLPKGHGRLIDADAVYDDFEKGEYDFEESLEFAPTIIPADTEGESEEDEFLELEDKK